MNNKENEMSEQNNGGLRVDMLHWDELSRGEQVCQPDNGSGADMATYLRVTHNGNHIATYSDAMEPEDVKFYRDLSWVQFAITDAYERGLRDAARTQEPKA